MQRLLLILIPLLAACSGVIQHDANLERQEAHAASTTIIRDKWGIPHVYGRTDADAVFGLMYAQCEDGFAKVERAYIEKLGRLCEVDGKQALYNDIFTQLMTDTAWAKREYATAAPWLKNLLNAFADGVNYYLRKHPNEKPLLLKRFEPWWPLLFADGAYVSVKTGGLSSEDFLRMYALPSPATGLHPYQLPDGATGSNAFAVAPKKTQNDKALLYINPHVTFDFRTEAHMVSDEGLNTYGAITWGQFFVFQGFNQHCGWMHTSSMADAADLYADVVMTRDGETFTAHNNTLKPVIKKTITLHPAGESQKRITAWYTHHGPAVGRTADGRLLSLKMMTLTVNSLMQSWLRTKAKGLDDFKATLKLFANATTNTMYADGRGNIAYWHGNFIPKRGVALDWSGVVDGGQQVNEWQGIHRLEEIVSVENPLQGFLQNCNSTPFTAGGPGMLSPSSYPTYMAPEGENFRSLLAIRELQKEQWYTMDKLTAVGYLPYLPAFDSLLPPLFEAYGQLAASDLMNDSLREAINVLKAWDKSSSATSVATTLAIEWAEKLFQANTNVTIDATDQINWMPAVVKATPLIKRLVYLRETMLQLKQRFGRWQVPWGDVNRYQRAAVDQQNESGINSLPVALASAFYGSLPAYETTQRNGRRWGYAGNSFVAVVEFDDSVKAKAIVPGGHSLQASSGHYIDQAALYINGRLRDVFFYRSDVEKAAESRYHPGSEPSSRD